MICQLCEQEKDLINAHIVPAAFYRDILPEKGALMDIGKDNPYSGKSWTGEYDSNILCKECDAYLGTFEEVSINLLRSLDKHEVILGTNPNIKAYKIDNLDYVKLKLSFISVVWKSSISKRIYSQAVDLGPYESKAKALLLRGEPGLDHEFSVALFKHRPSSISQEHPVLSDLHKNSISPIKLPLEGQAYYVFQFSEYEVFIKVGNKTIHNAFLPITLLRGEPLYIFEQDFDGSMKSTLMMNGLSHFQKRSNEFQLLRKSQLYK